MLRARLALVFALVIVMALSSAALADVSSIEVTVTPEELAEPGQVSVDIIIKNTSDTITMEEVTLEGPQINAYSVGNIAPLGTRGLQIPGIRISAEQLGEEFSYTLSWTEAGAQQSGEIPVLVRGRAGSPKLIASRTVDKEVLGTGETATLSYVIQNQGDVDLENITITDPALPEPVAAGVRLGVGEAAMTITKEVTMANASIMSVPKVTYTAQGQSGEVEVDALEIRFASAELDVQAQVVETTPMGTQLTITLTNNGNVRLAGMVIRDELGNEIQTGTALDPGESETIDYTVISNALRRFQVNVEGADEQGQPFTAQSSPAIEIKPLIDPTGVQLAFAAEADTSQLAETGKADVTFKITLGGDVVLSDAVITEETLGEVMSLGVLNTGETTRVQSFDIEGDTQLRFTLRAADSAGNPHTQAARTLDITLSQPQSAPPQDEPSASPSAEPEGEGAPIQGTLLTLIIVIGVLLAAAIVALIVLLVQDKKHKGSRQDEMEELEEMLESPKLSTKKPPEDEQWEDEPEDKPKFKLPRVPSRPSVRPNQGLPEGLRSAPPSPHPIQAPQAPQAAPPPRPGVPPQRPAPAVPRAAPPERFEPPVSRIPPAAPPTRAPAPPMARPSVPPPYQPPVQPPPIKPDSFDSGWDELDDEF